MSLHSSLRTFQSSLRKSFNSNISHTSLRYASINSAIGRGIRKSQWLEDSEGSSNRRRGGSERPSFNRAHSERPSFNRDRSEKPSFKRGNDRDERASRGRPERPSFGRGNDRDERTSRGGFKRPSYRRGNDRDEGASRGGFRERKFDEDKSVRRGGFRGTPRDDQQPEYSPRARVKRDSPVAKWKSAENWEERPDSQHRRRVGRQEPAEEIDEDEFIRTGNFRALPDEHRQRFQGAQDREAFSQGRAYKSPERPRANRDSYSMDKWSKDARNSRDIRDPDVEREDGLDKPRVSLRPDLKFQSQGRNSRDGGRAKIIKKVKPHRATIASPERVKEYVEVPQNIPYTTPASEFIYGTNAVEAALRCSKRQLYKLYLYQAVGETRLSESKITLRKLAALKGIQVKLAFGQWDELLDKMSDHRPHNGCVLEASPLPQTPVRALMPVQLEEDHFRVELAPQSREEASVNGTDSRVTINRSDIQQHRRHPVVLLLNGIVDTGNLGAIIRSSYYLGVDAIVFAGRNSAPLNPVTIKTSAGAAENMTLLDVRNEVEFILRSQANGWRFFAADALSPDATYIDPAALHARDQAAPETETNVDASNPSTLIGKAPTVIMMGNEGVGLSHHLKSHADAVVSIPGARHLPGLTDPARVDSLNVSVAAALLMETFLRVPLGISSVPKKGGNRMW